MRPEAGWGCKLVVWVRAGAPFFCPACRFSSRAHLAGAASRRRDLRSSPDAHGRIFPGRIFPGPRFVATAAYGSPLASDIGPLRRLPDRYLQSHAPGRALVAFYYTFGREPAHLIARHPTLRAITRASLAPMVAISNWLTTDH